ncbi:MAG: hypothetical protein IKL47_14300 [Clostridia bacterium]|nr:hypothetical protein [Clostridia bacterium]
MNCPKCGTPINRFDLAPNCKKCGVHIMYYTQEEDLARDAKKTELEFTSARILVAKIKAAFIKGKLPVIRIILLLLSAVSLILPVFELKLSFPWWEYKISAGAIGIYSIISDSFFSVLGSFPGLGEGKELFIVTLISFVLLLLSALSIIASLVMLILSFINIRKTAKMMYITGIIGAIFAAVNTVISFITVSQAVHYEFITATAMYGSVLCMIILAAFSIVNIMIYKAPPAAEISKADAKRLEIKRKLKDGEITLDELPLPIVEEDKKTTDKKEDKKPVRKKSARNGGKKK